MEVLKELKKNYPEFNSMPFLDEDQEKKFSRLLNMARGNLSDYKDEVSKANVKSADFKANVQKTKKAEELTPIKAERLQVMDKEAAPYGTILVNAKEAISQNIKGPQPETDTGKLLQYLQQKEIRDNLANMPLPERIKILQNSVQEGNGAALRAILSRPIASPDLIPANDLARFTDVFVEKAFPQLATERDAAKRDVSCLQALRDLTGIAMDHIERGSH